MDNDEYAIMSMSGFDFGIDIESALVFQADAVRMLHYDDFYQCAFWGPSVKGPMFHLKSGSSLNEDEWEAVEPHDRIWHLEGTDQQGVLFDILASLPKDPKPKPPRMR